MAKVITLLGASLCAAALLVGCSSNKGGDTTCKDFNAMDTAGKDEVISKMLKDDKGKDATNLEVKGTRVSAMAFCNTLGKDSSKVRDISTG